MKRKVEIYQPDYKNNHLQASNDFLLSELARSAKHAKELNNEIVKLREIADGCYRHIYSIEKKIKELNVIVNLLDEATNGDSPDLEKIEKIRDEHLTFRINLSDIKEID